MAVKDDRMGRAEQNYRRNLAERLSAATAVALAHGPNSASQRDLEGEYQIAKEKFEATQAELNERPPHIRFENPWMFWIPASVIFLIEAFINKIIVDMAAQTAGGVSLAVSAFLSLLLVWLSHNAGVSWRQIWSDLDRRIVWSSLIWGIVLADIVLTMVVLLMTLRAYFALVDTASGVDIFDTVKGIASLGFGFVMQAFSVPESLTIGGLNFLALIFAFLFAFLSHDSDKEYDRRYSDMNRTKRARNKGQARYVALQEKVHARFRRPISRALRVFVANRGSLESLEKDDFRIQLQEAERGLPPPPDAPGSGAIKPANDTVANPAAVSSRKPAATGRAGNPW